MCVCNEGREIGIVGTELGGFSNRIFVYVQGNNLRVFGEDPEAPAGDILIKYCPMCGRKLEKNTHLSYNPQEASKKAAIRYA